MPDLPNFAGHNVLTEPWVNEGLEAAISANITSTMAKSTSPYSHSE